MLSPEAQKIEKQFQKEAVQVLQSAEKPLTEDDILAALPSAARPKTSLFASLWLHGAILKLAQEGAIRHCEEFKPGIHYSLA